VPDPTHSSEPLDRFQPGQSLFFLGDHTTPDDPGYVGVMGEVLTRFQPRLNLRLISVGSQGQTASALRSQRLFDTIVSAHPDWLVIGLGLADAMQEPLTRKLLSSYRSALDASSEADAVFGPEYRVATDDLGPVTDVGAISESQLERLTGFRENLRVAVRDYTSVGIPCVLLTTIVVGNELENPANLVLRAYNRAIRDAAEESGLIVADVERAFRDLFTRASTYKQNVAVTDSAGVLNAQGQALVARTVLGALGLLPYPGYRPSRG
jgi:lysophospholipase L1-like esterase